MLAARPLQEEQPGLNPAKAPVMAAFVPLLASSQAAGPEPPGERCSPAEGAIQEEKEEDEERSVAEQSEHAPSPCRSGDGASTAPTSAQRAGDEKEPPRGRKGRAAAGASPVPAAPRAPEVAWKPPQGPAWPGSALRHGRG